MKKILGLALASATVATVCMFAGDSKIDVAKVFEKECQGCHGPNHEGGVGSSLDPKVIRTKNAYMLRDTILGGRAGTAMPAFKSSFANDPATTLAAVSLAEERPPPRKSRIPYLA